MTKEIYNKSSDFTINAASNTKNNKNYIRTFKIMKIRKIIDKHTHEIEFLKIAQLEKN